MSDRDDRTRTPDAEREASSTVPQTDTEHLQAPPEPLDVMPEEHFEEHGLGADPPMGADMPPASDDEALADIYDRAGAPIDRDAGDHGRD